MTFAISIQRENRIDLFRGISLLLIFIAHSNFSFSEAFQNARGFSDAAEMFVMLSGVSAALAYYIPSTGKDRKVNWRRPLERALKLYMVHITLVFCLAAIAGLLVLEASPTSETILDALNVKAFWSAPVTKSIETLSLTYMPGDFDIIPMYVILIACVPILFLIHDRSTKILALLSCLIWLVSGAGRINIPNTGVSKNYWFFDPFSWQIIFVIGLFIGIRIKMGKPALPYHKFVFSIALVFALLAIPANFLLHFEYIEPPFLELYKALISKTNVGFLRLANVIAIFYVAWNIPLVQRAANQLLWKPFCTLGKHSLPVFVLGMILSNAILCVMEIRPQTALALQLLYLVVGCVLQFALAQYLETRRAKSRSRAVQLKLESSLGTTDPA